MRATRSSGSSAQSVLPVSASFIRRPSRSTSRLEPSEPPLLKPRASTVTPAGFVVNDVTKSPGWRRSRSGIVATTALSMAARSITLASPAISRTSRSPRVAVIRRTSTDGSGRALTACCAAACSPPARSIPSESNAERNPSNSAEPPRRSVPFLITPPPAPSENVEAAAGGSERAGSDRTALDPRRAAGVDATGQVSWLMGQRDAEVARAPPTPSQASVAQWRCCRRGFPITVAGPRAVLTTFPLRPDDGNPDANCGGVGTGLAPVRQPVTRSRGAARSAAIRRS